MRHLHHTAHFTVFGGAYPAETHSRNPQTPKAKAGTIGPWAAVLVALVVGATTTAGAIAATQRIRTTDYGFQTAGRAENLAMPSLREMMW